YTVTLASTQPLPRRNEQEPNETADDASLFGKGRILKGTLNGQDTDHVLLLTTEAPQLWRIQAIGAGLHDLKYLPQHGESGLSVRADPKSRRLRLDNLFLLPGQHRFVLDAREDTRYVLRALPLGPPSAHIEREPNNDRRTAHRLRLNDKAVALLTEKSDLDYFRFHLAAPQPVELALKPAPDGAYWLTLYQDGEKFKQFTTKTGAGFTETLWLDPGDYFLEVRSGGQLSEAEYELRLDQVLEPRLVSDREPNDRPQTAAPWPVDGRFEGRLGIARAGADWYRLPPRSTPLTLALPEVDGARLAFVDVARRPIAKAVKDDTGGSTVALPAGAEAYLYLSGRGDYAFALTEPGTAAPAAPAPLPVAMTLTLDEQTIAAYSPWQQQLDGTLSLDNSDQQAQTLTLAGRSTDDRWHLILPQEEQQVPAGGSLELPVSLVVEPDALPDLPVALRVIASAGNRRGQARVAVEAVRGQTPRSPSVFEPVPDALRGHLNVAAAARGAQWRTDAKAAAPLNDGLLALGNYFESKREGLTGPATIAPVLELAGEATVAVTGFSLHPFGLQDSQAPQRNARDFAISLSQDGETFQQVLTGTLSGQLREQFFPLSEPVAARFARLELLSSRDPRVIALGEWKVLAAPSDSKARTPHNLADPALGGHVVWMSPAQPKYSYLEPLLTVGDRATTNRQRSGSDAAWVVGFHHNRAARIDRLDWHHAATGTGYPSVEILTSLDSPLGPWQSLGNWTLDGDGVQSIALGEPVWSRFVMFDVGDTPSGTTMTQPEQIEIFEAPDEHGSILGEWGYDSERGPYEQANPSQLLAALSERPGHTDQQSALPLKPGQPQAGRVSVGQYDNWYQLEVPEGHNRLALELSGVPSLRAEAQLLSASGETIELDSIEGAAAQQRVEANVAPGTYWVKVSEPPRSVIFTWDTSGSTAALRPIIRQAVLNYVNDVRPGI
ncbi:MAG: hypothetical protein AAGI15_17695, partial [Pseudomonadota bacterium]